MSRTVRSKRPSTPYPPAETPPSKPLASSPVSKRRVPSSLPSNLIILKSTIGSRVYCHRVRRNFWSNLSVRVYSRALLLIVYHTYAPTRRRIMNKLVRNTIFTKPIELQWVISHAALGCPSSLASIGEGDSETWEPLDAFLLNITGISHLFIRNRYVNA